MIEAATAGDDVVTRADPSKRAGAAALVIAALVGLALFVFPSVGFAVVSLMLLAIAARFAGTSGADENDTTDAGTPHQ